jgi:tetratricopeptide (TPR) repeat protein
MGQAVDFFVSYTSADRAWAEWIAWQLEDAGYTTRLQAWDFQVGGDFIHQMEQALRDAERLLLVLSPAYRASEFGEAEWRPIFTRDPSGELGLLIPVRVQDCDPPELLRGRVYVDLVGRDITSARAALLAAARRARGKPAEEPEFPGARPAAVERRNADQAEPRFPGQLPAIWNLPARSPTFTGREDLLTQLGSRLGASADQDGAVAVVPLALYGLGGVGKTQLALEYAYRHAADYDLAWWIPAQNPITIPTALAQLGSQLDIPETDDQLKLARAVLRALGARRRWLLVFDNAEEPDDLAGWLPTAGGGHVLLTSRHPDWSALAQPVQVGVLPHDKATELLLRRSPDDDAASAAELAEELGDLPLALEQAAAYLEREGTPLAAYLDAFRRRREELLSRGRAIAYQGQVDTTWQLSIDKVAPAGIELLRLCAFLAPEAIPLDLFAPQPALLPSALRAAVATDGELGVHEAAGACYRYSLVDRDRARIRVHRLVQQVVRARLAERDQRAMITIVTELLAAAFPISIEQLASPSSWPRCAELLPHLLAAAEHARQAKTAEAAAANLLMRAGSYLEHRGDYRAARGLLEWALAMVEAARGPDQLEVAYVLNALGYLLHTQRDPDQEDLAAARAAHERALRISQAALGPEHEDVGRTLNNLGHVLLAQGDLDGARAYLERALAVSKAALGVDHPEVASVLNNLGRVFRAKGNLADARAAHERALAIKEAHPDFGPDSPSVARTRWLLSGVLQDQGDLAEARAQLERAHAIFQATLGLEHPDTEAVARELASQRSR